MAPLHYAAENDHLCVVEYLVNQNVDINSKDHCVWFICFVLLHFTLPH